MLVVSCIKVHGKAQKKAFNAKIKDICHIPTNVARYLYKELTGDESEEVNVSCKERQAALEERAALVENFVLRCGDPGVIQDLRCLENAKRKGETCFTEFWSCVQQELDAMTLAADERRHSGVVAYLSEIISHKKLYEKVVTHFEEKKASGVFPESAKAPSCKWFKFQFWPSNEHTRASLQFTGRFPLKLQLHVRNMRKAHAHPYYCAKQKKLVEAWVHKYREFTTAGQPDDKANGTVGEPGMATSFLSRQRMALASTDSPDGGLQAMDHDAGSSKLRFIPSVFLKQEIPEDINGSWLRGKGVHHA